MITLAMTGVLRTRRECPEISWGEFTVLRTNVPEVLAMRYDWRNCVAAFEKLGAQLDARKLPASPAMAAPVSA